MANSLEHLGPPLPYTLFAYPPPQSTMNTSYHFLSQEDETWFYQLNVSQQEWILEHCPNPMETIHDPDNKEFLGYLPTEPRELSSISYLFERITPQLEALENISPKSPNYKPLSFVELIPFFKEAVRHDILNERGAFDWIDQRVLVSFYFRSRFLYQAFADYLLSKPYLHQHKRKWLSEDRVLLDSAEYSLLKHLIGNGYDEINCHEHLSWQESISLYVEGTQDFKNWLSRLDHSARKDLLALLNRGIKLTHPDLRKKFFLLPKMTRRLLISICSWPEQFYHKETEWVNTCLTIEFSERCLKAASGYEALLEFPEQIKQRIAYLIQKPRFPKKHVEILDLCNHPEHYMNLTQEEKDSLNVDIHKNLKQLLTIRTEALDHPLEVVKRNQWFQSHPILSTLFETCVMPTIDVNWRRGAFQPMKISPLSPKEKSLFEKILAHDPALFKTFVEAGLKSSFFCENDVNWFLSLEYVKEFSWFKELKRPTHTINMFTKFNGKAFLGGVSIGLTIGLITNEATILRILAMITSTGLIYTEVFQNRSFSNGYDSVEAAGFQASLIAGIGIGLLASSTTSMRISNLGPITIFGTLGLAVLFSYSLAKLHEKRV